MGFKDIFRKWINPRPRHRVLRGPEQFIEAEKPAFWNNLFEGSGGFNTILKFIIAIIAVILVQVYLGLSWWIIILFLLIFLGLPMTRNFPVASVVVKLFLGLVIAFGLHSIMPWFPGFLLYGLVIIISLIWITKSMKKKEAQVVAAGGGGGSAGGSGGAGGRGGSSVQYGAGKGLGENLAAIFFKPQTWIVIMLIGVVIVGLYNKDYLAERGKYYGVTDFFRNSWVSVAGQQGFIHQWFYESYGFTNPNAMPQEIKKGIKIMSELKPLRSYYLINEKPELGTKVYVDALDVDTNAFFYFRINLTGKDKSVYDGRYKYGRIKVNGEELTETPRSTDPSIPFVDSSIYNIPRNQNKTLFLTTEFDSIPISVTEQSKKFDVEFGAIYKYNSKSRLRAYTLQGDKLESLKDPFNDISYAYLNKRDRTTETECISGCGLATLSMTITAEQPLTEKGEYNLGIRLLEASDWSGKINKIWNLKVFVPTAFGPITEKCMFQGANGEYTLKSNYLTNLNSKLNQTLPDITYWCAFKVNNPKTEVGMYENIVAEVDYDYLFENLDNAEIEIRKIEGAS